MVEKVWDAGLEIRSTTRPRLSRGRFREELGGSALIAVAINRGYCEVKVGEGSVDRIKGKMGLRQQGGCEILGARDVDGPLGGDVDVIAEFF